MRKNLPATGPSNSSLPRAWAFFTQVARRLILMSTVLAAMICAEADRSARAADKRPQAKAAKSAPPLTTVLFDGKPVTPLHGSISGFWMYCEKSTPQLALMAHQQKTPHRIVVALDKGQQATMRIPLPSGKSETWFSLQAKKLDGSPAVVALGDGAATKTSAHINDEKSLAVTFKTDPKKPAVLSIDVSAPQGATSVSLGRFDLKQDDRAVAFRIAPRRRAYPEKGPVACSPVMHTAIEKALIEWDWRLQDGVGTPLESRSYAKAVKQILDRGDLLLADLGDSGVDLGGKPTAWSRLHQRNKALKKKNKATRSDWESLWLDTHRLRREIVLSNPLLDTGPLLFAKRVPATMSHQLTQYYGYAAQPGGGLFVLDEPGRSMRVRRFAESLPTGSYLRPEVSYDASTIYFAFCECETPPIKWRDPTCMDRRYHLYSMDADGKNVRKLTNGPYDDHTPIELPSGKLMFSSSRRGGYHRCGGGPCYVYSLALAEADGSNPHSISFHETNEWDPAVLNDGRVVYTRWDYVDRNAVFYQQLWSVRQDGSDVRIFFGNNTLNPLGTWETRPVPGLSKVMATAAPHHGISAGSIILLDTARGVDGMGPIERLTPDALFPEAETALAYVPPKVPAVRFDDNLTKAWGPWPQSQPTRLSYTPVEEKRWQGHCYRSPYPLSEKFFLAAYSYDRLRGENGANRPNMFGLYAVDAFGNKELLYRDANISSQWPIPLRPRVRPRVLEMPSTWAGSDSQRPEGTFFLRNVHESWPKLPNEEIKQLRIVQVLPKTTPNANNPRVGKANASPGKQVLGTVPVERDGSAYFRVPARTPVMFQALDARGRAVQTMRSLTYLQPGEQVSCVGCHESRTHAPESLVDSVAARPALALNREPSTISPGPDGSKPLSYPILVQPVLDRHCIECHKAKKPEGKVILTGEPDGEFSKSYNALIPYVSFSSWGAPDFNHEPMTTPDRFGARNSRLVELLDKGHYDVKLTPEEWDRIVTWIDANALFYGTFNREDQKKQQRGERIAGPDLE